MSKSAPVFVDVRRLVGGMSVEQATAATPACTVLAAFPFLGAVASADTEAIPETIKVDGKTRPTRNNLDQLIHPTSEGIINFWKWFGDSKIIDEHDRPLVCYHGTRNGGFDTFKPNYRKNEQLGMGVHFARNERLADMYANDLTLARKGKNPEVYSCYLKIDNPLYSDRVCSEGSIEYAMCMKLSKNKAFTSDDGTGKKSLYIQAALDMAPAKLVEKTLTDYGYDGIDYIARVGTIGVNARITSKEPSLIVFDAIQIKSATKNSGAFNPSSYSVTAAARRPTRAPAAGVYPSNITPEGRELWDRLVATTPVSRQLTRLQDDVDAAWAYMLQKYFEAAAKANTKPFRDASVVSVLPQHQDTNALSQTSLQQLVVARLFVTQLHKNMVSAGLVAGDPTPWKVTGTQFANSKYNVVFKSLVDLADTTAGTRALTWMRSYEEFKDYPKVPGSVAYKLFADGYMLARVLESGRLEFSLVLGFSRAVLSHYMGVAKSVMDKDELLAYLRAWMENHLGPRLEAVA